MSPDTSTGTTDTAEAVAHVARLVERARLAMFTTTSSDGTLVSRPMALQDTEFDGDLWFFTYDDSHKAREIAADPRVNVSFANDKSSEWTSLSGTAEIVHDLAKAEELYTKYLEVWFPDGLDTPGLALIKVHADTAEWWESSDSKVKRVLGMARAIRSGDPDKFPAENETVDL